MRIVKSARIIHGYLRMILQACPRCQVFFGWPIYMGHYCQSALLSSRPIKYIGSIDYGMARPSENIEYDVRSLMEEEPMHDDLSMIKETGPPYVHPKGTAMLQTFCQ